MLSLAQLNLILKIITYSVRVLASTLSRSLSARVHRLRYRPLPPSSPTSPDSPCPPQPQRTVLVVGASFAGYHAARLLAAALPPSHRVCVVEPRSHFVYTWALPRYAVVRGHEAHAFIPFGGYLSSAPKGSFTWRRDAVVALEKGKAVLRSGGEVQWDYVVVATGAANRTAEGSVGRMMGGVEGKAEGVEVLRRSQERVREAERVVVVGGGAVGVEVATDAKSLYPEKSVTLVHSRGEVMGRFGEGLREAARRGLEELGVEVVLGERVVRREDGDGAVVLSSGRRVECDFLIDSTGQKPVSGIIADLSPSSISESGHIRVKPTMQIADDSLPNVYVAGDVAQADVRNSNARSAMLQATVAADNILLAVRGKEPQVHYEPSWIDGSILLTLGLKRDVIYISDGETELLFNAKSKGPSMNAAGAWRHMGAKPFVDDGDVNEKIAQPDPIADARK